MIALLIIIPINRINTDMISPPKKYIIVEGSYSMHPYFGDDYDLGIFCDVDPITQMKRIESRAGLEKAKMFQNLWKKPILKNIR